MTLCLLVRHASHHLVGRVLVGRQGGVSINEEGYGQVVDLAQRLSALGITHVQSSPRGRALQTAEPIAKHLGRDLDVCDALDEVDFGSWTGRSLGDLEEDPAWRSWNEERALSRAPGGESMAEVQARIIAHLQGMGAQLSGARIVMVSHAEVIRAVVLHCMAQPLGAWLSVQVLCASVTSVEIDPRGALALYSRSW